MKHCFECPEQATAGVSLLEDPGKLCSRLGRCYLMPQETGTKSGHSNEEEILMLKQNVCEGLRLGWGWTHEGRWKDNKG